MKMKLVSTTGIAIMLSMSACSSGVPQQEYESVAAEALQFSQELETLKKQNTTLESEKDALNTQVESLSADFNTYKESMSAYEGLALAEAQAKQIEAEAVAASKAAEEEAIAAAAAAQKEAEEKAGYETGIKYDQLARTPDDYVDKKIKFKGKVIQVLEGDDQVQIRLAVNSNYDTILYGTYLKDIVSSRVLEDDVITVYGTSTGLLSYQSTMGGTVTIPSTLIDKIDQ